MVLLLDYFKRYGFYLFLLILTLCIYCMLFGIYAINDIDNPWSAAWIHHFFNHGITHDMVFCDGASQCWGVRFFSKIYAYFYGGILSLIGFSLPHIQLISHGLIFLSLLNWFLIAKKLLNQAKPAFWFVILLSLSAPVMSVANSARVDALVFFFMSFSFCLWLNEQFILSIFMSFLAIETHPIGGITLFYLFSYWVWYQRALICKRQFWFQCLAGVLLGGGLYVLLHFSELNHFSDIYPTIKGTFHDNFLCAFFYQNQAWQYQEDLIFFSLAVFIYFFRTKKKQNYFPFLVSLVILSSLIFRRGNPHYAIFFYPAFFLFSVHALWGIQYRFFKIEYLFALVLALDVNHCLHLARSHQRVGQLNDYLSQVKNLALPKAIYIYGDPIDYFALYDHPTFRVLGAHLGLHPHFYFLEHIQTIFSDDRYDFDSNKWKYKKIKTMHLRSGGIINVYQVDQRSTRSEVK